MIRRLVMVLLLAGCEKVDDAGKARPPAPTPAPAPDAGVIGPRRIVLPQPPVDARAKVVISIDRDRHIFVGSREVDEAGLPRALDDLRHHGLDAISILADDSLPYGVVVRVVEMIKQAGFTKVQVLSSQDQVQLQTLPRRPGP
jgi:hypothetical protein